MTVKELIMLLIDNPSDNQVYQLESGELGVLEKEGENGTKLFRLITVPRYEGRDNSVRSLAERA